MPSNVIFLTDCVRPNRIGCVGPANSSAIVYHYSDWVCTAVMSNDVMKDLRG